MTHSQAFRLDRLVERIASINPMHARSLGDARAGLFAEERDELEAYLSFCESDGVGIDDLAAAYQTITMDTLREQVFFQRHRHYRHSTFKDVADKVYFDAAYMKRYMYGLALTLYLWPNHLEIVRFFRKAMPLDRGGRYLEIGPGHGVFFSYAATNGGFTSLLGIDISPTSLEMTRKLLGSHASLSGADWRLVNADFLATDDLQGRFDAIVMGEVLEHVEEPLRFLARIRDLARNGAFVFVTTAVNAPAVDHIYLFRTVDDVCDLAIAAGLQVKDLLATPYKGCSMEETVEQRLPVNVAMVLEA